MATKREVLEALKTVSFVETAVGDTVVTKEDVDKFIENSLVQMDKLNALAAKKAEEKKIVGDETRQKIKAALSADPKTIKEIMVDIDDEAITTSMVVSRLTQLCKLGEVNKEDAKVGDRKLKVYSLV